MREKRKGRFSGKTTADAQRQKTKGSQYGHLKLTQGVSVFKEKGGAKIRLDILPYEVTDAKHPDRDDDLQIAVPGELWYKRPYKLHRNVGVNKDVEVCPTSFGKKCPICEYRAKLLQDGADWQDEAVKALRPSDRNLYVVIPLGEKDFDEKPHIWDISKYCFQDMLNDELEEDPDVGEFPDLENGFTLRIRFSEESIGKNSFGKAARIDFDERDKGYNESILDDVPNLDEVITCLPYGQLEAKFFELDEGESKPQEVKEEEAPEPTTQRRRERKSTPDVKQPERRRNREQTPEPKDEPPFEPSENTCVACEGTGTDSKGRKCRICDGTGEKPASKEEKEPLPTRRNIPRPSKTETKGRCPYGHEFGPDCEEFDDCDTCDLFEACLDAKVG